MRSRVCGIWAAALFTAVTVMVFSTISASALADSAGTVHFVRFSEPSFDQYLDDPSPSMREWLNTHFWRMGVYTPYFDSKTAWYPNGWLYKDSYALYTNESAPVQHPEWVLKDAAGNPLYIQWGCSNGACPQYAADIANQAFRQWWIGKAKTELSAGYRGLFIDDVNMEMRVSNGREETVAPIDPSTGQAMTTAAWRGYMAQFMQEIRAALPGVELVHNAIWFSDNDAGAGDASIRSEISASNYIYLERGVNDSGLTGGDGQWSLNTFLSFIDQVHALGRGVVLDGTASDPRGLEYNLAAYFLTSTGNDAVSGGGQTPTNWWAGWNVNLGEASGPRYTWNGLLRRDFEGGMVLVNSPDEPTRTVTLSTPMQNVSGATVTSVTLTAASSAILTGTPSSTAPVERQSEAPAGTATATETTVAAEPLTASAALANAIDDSGDGDSHGSEGSRPTSGTTSTPPTTQPSRGRSGRHRPRRQAQKTRAGHAFSARRHREVLTRVKGLVKRATRGHVTIELEARRGHRWVRVRLSRASVSPKGYFTRLFHLSPSVRYRVRALYGGAPGYRPSRSGYRQIKPRLL
jgi:Hypothetical glycosyl hydrolase family 15